MKTLLWPFVFRGLVARRNKVSASTSVPATELRARGASSAPAASQPPEVQPWRRRQVLGALLAGSAAGCAGFPRMKLPAQHLPPEGMPIYSESVQLSLADTGGENFLSIRLCQYPDAGIAWLWAAVLIDGEFIQVADNAVPWQGVASVFPGEAQASYAAQSASASLSFVRSGTLSQPVLGRMNFASRTHPGAQVEVTFLPSDLYQGLIPGRAEVFGRAVAELSIGDRSFKLEGPGQWHEQQQSNPRFVTPFVYASLWGKGIFATFLQTPEASGGYLISSGGVTEYAKAEFNGPQSIRQVRMMTADGLISDFRFEQRHQYTLDIYGKPWRGSFVHGKIEDSVVSGFLNSWLSMPG